MKKDFSQYFRKDYYEKIGGYKIRGQKSITLGNHGSYRWDYKGFQTELGKRWNFIKKFLLMTSWQKVLFIGCGKGFEVLFFRNQNKDAWGIDFSEYAIENAHPDIEDYVFREDICNMKRFKENEFDIVASFDVLALIRRGGRKKAVKKISQLARKYIIIRTKVLGSREKKKRGPDAYDGSPVYLETPQYWVRLFENCNKFKFKLAVFYRTNFGKVWMIFQRK